MKGALLLLALSLAGCVDPVMLAARIGIAVDETIIASEKSYPSFDRAKQATLTDDALKVYRETERPRVAASFEALTAAAHGLRQGIELGAAGKLDLSRITATVCDAANTFESVTTVVGWKPPEALGRALSLCAGGR